MTNAEVGWTAESMIEAAEATLPGSDYEGGFEIAMMSITVTIVELRVYARRRA